MDYNWYTSQSSKVVSSSSMGLSLKFVNLGTMTFIGHGSIGIRRCII
jgi:hypothetical protein